MAKWGFKRGETGEIFGGKLPLVREDMHSQDAPPPPADIVKDDRWIGFIDYISSARISGWACDRDNPNVSVMVEAMASDGQRVVAIANVFRGDVRDAGYGDGWLGFDLDISRMRMTSGTIDVRFAENGAPISAVPIEFDPQMALINGTLSDKYARSIQSAAAGAKLVYSLYKNTGTIFG